MAGALYLFARDRMRECGSGRAKKSPEAPAPRALRGRSPSYLRSVQLAGHERGQGSRRPGQVVVSHHVAESMCLLQLCARKLDSPLDLPGALGRALAQPALELVDVGSDEDGDAPGHVGLNGERALALEFEDADLGSVPDALDLGAERAVATSGHVRHTFQEVLGLDAVGELVVGEEPVVGTVALA